MASVACLQIAINEDEPVSDRVRRVMSLIDAQSADMVALPELWHVGAFDLESAKAHAESIDGPLITELSDAARRNSIWLHGGSFTEKTADGTHYNTSVLFDPAGNLVATYRKIHLFGFADGERRLMSGGDELVVIDTPLGATGLATCYDLRFPELFRALTDGGAETFLIASGWPDKRIEHWRILNKARAIENQAWVVACNEVGTHANTTLGGYSAVINPLGVAIAEGDATETTVTADIDPQAARAWRKSFPVLDDRTL